MAPTYWDPEWLEFAKSLGSPPTIPEGETEEKRQMVNGILEQLPKLLPPPPDDVTTKDLTVPNGPAIRIYSPVDSEGKQSPLLLFAHGGGWFAGNLDTEDRTCRIICSRARVVVVSVDYACDYNVMLQTMVRDLLRAFDWCRENAASNDADPDKIVLWGGSAGGALVISLAYRLINHEIRGQDMRGREIRGLICMNTLALHPDAVEPEYQHLMTSYEENDGPLPFVAKKDTLRLYEYRGLVPPDTPLSVFPTAGGAGEMAGFPPTFIITSGNDASRDDGTVLEAVLKKAGTRVKRVNFEGLAHYFWVFNLPKANERFWETMVEGVNWVLEG